MSHSKDNHFNEKELTFSGIKFEKLEVFNKKNAQNTPWANLRDIHAIFLSACFRVEWAIRSHETRPTRVLSDNV